jgi:MYXO-CTERM domain-containing protein
MKSTVWLAAAALAVSSSALAGPDWDVDLAKDAGSTLQSSQVITFGGPVQTIAGRLRGTAVLEPDFHDVYKLVITSPGDFIIDLTGGVNFDACLWLFDENGIPLLGNNDAGFGNTAPKLTNTSNGGASVSITSPGIYFLAISGFSAQPLSFGEPLWPSDVFNPGIVAGSFATKSQWAGEWSGEGAIGDYVMTVSGVAGVPAPGAIALLGAAGLIGRRRRRAVAG